MLGIEKKSVTTDAEKKFDKKFVIVIILVSIIGLTMIILPAYIRDIENVGRAGIVVIAVALVINLIKGYFDWKRDTKRRADLEAEQNLQPRAKFTDFDPTEDRKTSQDGGVLTNTDETAAVVAAAAIPITIVTVEKADDEIVKDIP